MRKIKIEMILDEEVGMTTESLVGIINSSNFQLAFPDDYDTIKATPVFGCENITVLIERKNSPNPDLV